MILDRDLDAYLIQQYRMERSLLVPSYDFQMLALNHRGKRVEQLGVILQGTWNQICANAVTVQDAGNEIIQILEGAIAQGNAGRPAPPPARPWVHPSERKPQPGAVANSVPRPLMDQATGLWYDHLGTLLDPQPQVSVPPVSITELQGRPHPVQTAPVQTPQPQPPQFSDNPNYVQPDEHAAGAAPYPGFDQQMGPTIAPPQRTPDYTEAMRQANSPPAPMVPPQQLAPGPTHAPRTETPMIPPGLEGPPPGIDPAVFPIGESAGTVPSEDMHQPPF